MPVESLRPAHDLAHSTAANNTDSASSYSASFADAYDHASQQSSSHGGAASPVAPAYSPITPKVQPVLPAYSAPAFANAHHGAEFTFAPVTEQQQQQQRRTSSGSPHTQQQHVPAMVPAQGQSLAKSIETQPPPKPARIPPTEYIPQPANLPFSGEDSGDAIALRAAISTLQIQKKKAQDDIKTLATIKQLALEDPATFHQELAAGRLREQKPSLRDILDNMEDDDDDEDEVVLGASRDEDQQASQRTVRLPSEIPDSQPSQAASGDIDMDSGNHAPQKQFPRIPAPQNVVRMPHINWDKYGIVGHPLDDLHEQQRKWPGTLGGAGGEKGREYAIAAPYSPWEDKLHDQQPGQAHMSTSDTLDGGIRKDSGAPVPSATGTISEHVMETRSRN